MTVHYLGMAALLAFVILAEPAHADSVVPSDPTTTQGPPIFLPHYNECLPPGPGYSDCVAGCDSKLHFNIVDCGYQYYGTWQYDMCTGVAETVYHECLNACLINFPQIPKPSPIPYC